MKRNVAANLIGSCGDDGLICLWVATTPMHVVRNAHDGDVNGMEFHPTNEHLFWRAADRTTS
jgi:hypothetical protein